MRRRTVRTRFTALYGSLFLLSGAFLLAIAGIVAYAGMDISQTSPFTGQPQPIGVQIRVLQEQLDQVHAVQSRQLLAGALIALAVMAVLSVALGRFVAGRVLRPLRAMTAATRRITADSLHERLDVPGPRDEVKDLADTIDELLERLESAFAAQRRFVANASHELRTPLATMRASLDVAVAKPDPAPPQTIVLAERVRAELDQVERLLEGFLTLARTQHDDLPGRAPLALGDVVSAALAARTADIAARDLTVEVAVAEAVVEGSPTLLRRMVDNLVDNAIRHNRDGGWMHLMVEPAASEAVLVVETGGPVLDQDQVDRLAQPFRRLGADRVGSDGGAGLGLSIVAAVAAAHGGDLALRARPSGGLRVDVSLPLAVAVPA
ncbi:HAMP domain-containing histidine kinase [Streptosporangiaceae bacterium NEAU-GS5]|nr:HAMP domain-containing histidine kinase [Streptosporangiaceae bacterium NEAU-GS5]